MVNVQALQKELDFIVSHLDQWNQSVWARSKHQPVAEMTVFLPDCGTAYCLAGNTCVNNGYVFVSNGASISETMIRQADVDKWKNREDVTLYSPSDVAQELLDLDYEEVDALFCGDNSLVGLFALASYFSNGEIRVPTAVGGYWQGPGLFAPEDEHFRASVDKVLRDIERYGILA